MGTAAPATDLKGLAPPLTERVDLPDGAFLLRSPQRLDPYARCVGEWIEHWARATPDAIALKERDPDGHWRETGYPALRQAIGAIGQALLDLDLPQDKPVVVLSDNGTDHALLMLAAMHVGRPVCTVSSAYSRQTRDHTRLAILLKTLDPALIYAVDTDAYGAALSAARHEAGVAAPVVVSRGADPARGLIDFASLRAVTERPAVREAFAAIRPDDTAKYLLTSGSTGQPKVVINTHRMLCANQQMIRQVWGFLGDEKPVIVDWLPWSHTFGGNHNLHLALANGGTLVIDEGRPAPGLIERTLTNLREIRPTLWFNVPRGFDMALPFLEADAALARDVFSRLRAVFYAGAALPQATWERLDAVARRARDEPVWFTTSWGATETAPAITSAHWKLDRAGVIGLPLPGMELKFVPEGGKLEMRVRGLAVFPGYRNAPELTAAAFDDEGFYRIGDAGRLLDPARPERGVVFDGRVAEDFKLGSGTWVSVGMLRVRLVSALAPYVQDVVITGHERDEIGVLAFPNAQGAALAPEVLADHIRTTLTQLRVDAQGSAQAPRRALVLRDPPSADAGEITDKGYVNQRAVLQRRADQVEALHAVPTRADVIVVD